MSDIEARALALVNKVGFTDYASFYDVDEVELRDTILHLIRERDAFRQEVSECMLNLMSAYGVSREDVADFIIQPKTDPLVEVVKALQDGRSGSDPESYAACLRNELKSRGLEIRETKHD